MSEEFPMPIERVLLEDVTRTDLQELINGEVIERRVLEYKRGLPGNSQGDRKEFLRDVSSFANASGGHLIYGLREDNGRPVDLCGVGEIDPDAEIGRLANMVRDGVRPRISSIAMHPIRLDSQNHAILVRIPASWAKPHMVVFQEDGKFYSRSPNGKYAMDVDEIRAAFLLSGMTVERIRVFRIEQIKSILSARRHVTLSVAGRLVLHVFPLSAFSNPRSLDVSFVDRDEDVIQLFPPQSSRIRYDLDGVLFYPFQQNTPVGRYIHVFRDGNLELFDSVPLVAQKEKTIFETELESKIATRLKQLLAIQRRLGVNPPLAVLLSLLGCRDYNLNITTVGNPWGNGHPITADPLLIPEVTIEAFESDLGRLLRPIYDGLWLACGWPRSMNYNESGQRVAWYSQRG